MLKDVALHISGIKRKQATDHKEVNGIKTYFLTEDLNDFHAKYNEEEQERYYKHLQLFIELDNHLFPLGSVQHINELEKYTEQQLLDMFNSQVDRAIETIKRPSLGVCQYFNREDDYKKALENIKEKEENDRAIRKEKERAIAEQKERENKLELDNAMITFRNGDKINGELFVGLCDQLGVKLPLRTRGWVLNKLQYISLTNYWAYTDSTVIFDYVGELELEIKKKEIV